MKFALLSVSYAGLFYNGKALSIEEQIHKAKALGFDALSIETKRPVASPIDISSAQRLKIKSLASTEGIEICAIESLSNFSSQFMEERENNLAMMKMVLELAKDLGVKIVKVFAAWPGVINDQEAVAMYGDYEKGNYYTKLKPTDLRKWDRAVKGIREVADWAKDMGITLALQNHAPVLRPGYEDLLAMQQDIDRDNVKLCLDAPLFYTRQSDEYIREAVNRCAKNIVLTHYGTWNFVEKEDGQIVQVPAHSYGEIINYESFFSALADIGYDGYIVGESCSPVMVGRAYGGIENVDKANIITLRHMKKIYAQISKTTK